MAEVQAPLDDAAHVRSYESKEKDVLIEELDALLERYLRTLDEYDRARRQLASQLSSGYMSLAQANFHNSSSAVRFGQDCYDERMQAIRKVTISESESSSDEKVNFSVVSKNIKGPTKDKANGSAEEKGEKDASEEAESTESDPAKDAEAKGDADPDVDDTENLTKESKASGEKLIDPIRWFGILVPPALRQAQSSFVSAIEGPVPQLTTLMRDLRSQEIDIGRVRKQIRKSSDNA